MKTRAKYHWLMVAILLVTLIASCRPQEEPTPTPIPTPIVPEKPTYAVQRGTVIKSIHFTGRIAPVREEKLFFKKSGYIKSVLVKKGDAVKEGDLLAELEIGDLGRQLAQAELNLEMAQIRLEEAERGNALRIAKAEMALAIAQLRLEQAKANDPSAQVTIAKANLDRAAVALQRAQAEYDRVSWNPALASGPAQILQEATFQHQIAQAQYEQALQAQAAHEYALRILEEEVKLAKLTLQKLKEGVDPLLVKEVERVRLAVEGLKAQVNDARILAPFNGQVMSVAAHAGEHAEAFEPLIILADLTSLEISAALGGEEMGEISIGQPATIVLADYPGRELAGEVRRLPYPFGAAEALEEVDKSVRISFDPKDWSWKWALWPG